MKYHIDHNNKSIYFWSAKIGVTSAIECIIHLQSGDLVFNEGKDEQTHNIFWSKYKSKSKNGVDYSSFKKVFFGRNPYHRIVSSFFDKVICPYSPGMKNMPKVNNFHEFIRLIYDCGMNEEKLCNFLDYHQFCDLCELDGWDFYCKLNKPKFDLILFTPETGLPENKIIQDYESIKSLYKILNKENEFKNFNFRIKDNPYKFSNEPDLYKKNINDIIKYTWKNTEAKIRYRYMDFYNDEIIKMFNEIYKNEFDFYKTLGFDYMIKL